MVITNKLALPEVFIKWASDDNEHRPVDNRFSVTELLKPIREIALTRSHYDEIERDVADAIPSLFGTAVHKILEDTAPKEEGVFTEYKVEAAFGDCIVSGRIDLLDLNRCEISDYKTTSASKVMKNDFDDWDKQNLAYALLVFMVTGKIVRRIRNYVLMKDWSKVKAASNPNYPQSAIYIHERDVADSDLDGIRDWIWKRLAEIKDVLSHPESALPECTDEEKWYTGTKYAAMKNGRKTAVKVFDSYDEAITYASDNGLYLENRPGEYLKCKLYCDCCRFCKKGEQK